VSERTSDPGPALALAVSTLTVAAVIGLRWSGAVGGRSELEQARAFYASQPRYLQPVPHSPVPAGLPDARAETCAQCHREFYDEWKVSTHARAWLDDAQFQEELKKTTKTPGRDAGWMCVNCHTPMESQLPRLVVRLEGGDRGRPVYTDNPHFDPQLQLEAITCGTCHLRDGVVLGPYGDTDAPHPVRKAPELLAAQVCTQCHQAQDQFPEVDLACMFQTGSELAQGAHAGKTCQDCHMPEVERSLTNLGTPARKTRRHWFGGSLIPKRPEDEADLAPLREVFPDGLTARWVDLPERLAPGEEANLEVEVQNAEAGHMLPTGDPERFLRVSLSAHGSDGGLLAEHEERIGSVYDWNVPVTLLSDNRLAPLERRRYALRFTAPASGPVTLRLVASKWRLSAENLAYHHLEGRAVPGRVFLDEETRLPVGATGR
jgi:hypothetical protein